MLFCCCCWCCCGCCCYYCCGCGSVAAAVVVAVFCFDYAHIKEKVKLDHMGCDFFKNYGHNDITMSYDDATSCLTFFHGHISTFYRGCVTLCRQPQVWSWEGSGSFLKACSLKWCGGITMVRSFSVLGQNWNKNCFRGSCTVFFFLCHGSTPSKQSTFLSPVRKKELGSIALWVMTLEL